MEVYTPVTVPDLFEGARYRLSDNVNWLTPSDAHWQGGISYEANCTEVAVTMMTCISGASVDAKALTFERIHRGARPATIYAETECTPSTEWWEVGQTRVLTALQNSGPTQMERTFWTGASGAEPALVYPNLTSTGVINDPTNQFILQPSATIISGVALDVVEGLGQLEDALALCYDGVGWIHVPVRLVASLAAHGLCYREGSKLYTYRGNLIVVGNGYDFDYGPAGAAAPAGSGWMFATSPVFGYRATPRTFERTASLDRSVDTYVARAEQTYLLAWHCCLIGVLVSTAGEPAGTAGA